MNVIKFEMKRNLKTTLIWSVVVSLIAIMYIAMSPLFVDQADTIMGFMESLGENFMNGLGIDFATFFTPVGYFSYVGGYLFAALAIQASLYGIKAFVTEKNQKSVEFIYTRPGSRTKLFINKFVANILLLTITQIIVIGAVVISTDLFNSMDYDHNLMLMEACSLIPLQYMFYTAGVLIGVSVNRLKNVVSISIMLGMGMYILNMLASMLDSQLLGNISFFYYYNLSDIVSNGGYDTNYVLVSIGIIIALTIVSLLVYNRRDLKTL